MSGELPVTVSEGRKIFGGLSCHRAEDGKAASESVRSWETPPAAVEFKGVSPGLPFSKRRTPTRSLTGLNLTVRKGGKGRPDRLQRGGKIYADEDDDWPAQAISGRN